MLTLLNGNWEKSERTSLIYPSPSINAGTAYVQLNIHEVMIPVVDEDGTEHEEAGYGFDEYHINHAVDLPQEALDALMSAFANDAECLKIVEGKA